MSLKEDLHDLALENGMDYFGVSSIDRFDHVPAGHRPADLLPAAKAIIVLGVAIPESAVEANNRAFAGVRHCIFSYVTFGYNKPNDSLDLAAFRLMRRIEKKEGKCAYPIPSSQPRDEEIYMGALSNRYAAVCAGLGEFGWSGFAVTPKHGPRVRWISLITEAELEPDPLYGGPRLCDHTQCSVCVDACPVGALSPDQKIPVKIGSFETAYSLRNKPLCRCATAGLSKGTPGRLQAEIPHQMNTMNDWLQLSKKDNPWQRMEFSHGNYCHRCMITCPVGRPQAV